MECAGAHDIEGKATRVGASESGGERVSMQEGEIADMEHVASGNGAREQRHRR